jgi:hypothetical protein
MHKNQGSDFLCALCFFVANGSFAFLGVSATWRLGVKD